MHAAIVTRFRCATDTRGARIAASSIAGRLSVPYDHALSLEENHRAAAVALLYKTGRGDFVDQLMPGELPDGSCAHVIAF